MLHSYVGHYVTCDWPGCTVQTGGFPAEEAKGPALAHWGHTEDGQYICPKHRPEMPELWD